MKKFVFNIILAILIGSASNFMFKATSNIIDATKKQSDIAIKELPPIVANLSNEKDVWVRLEASLIYNPSETHSVELMASTATFDILNYLRSLRVEHFEGSFALQYLRNDLMARLKMRFNTQVKEIIIQSLVIQ